MHFIITKDGRLEITGTDIRPINDSELLESHSSIADKEVSKALEDMGDNATKIISSLSGLSPGIKDGQPVAVRFTLPIMMKLE